ncbi:MAG TPA: molybdopterin-binding protein [Clostridiales bacterium]|nr:molybdopterin-binding protein [Clostridiales bacterium]
MRNAKKATSQIVLIALLAALLLSLAACGTPGATPTNTPETGPSGTPQTTPSGGAKTGLPALADLPAEYQRETKTEAINERYAPRITTLENGVRIQRTPTNTEAGDRMLVTSWNNVYLNADNRGCTACHTLEDALADMDTYHGIVTMGYETEQTVANCFGCHYFYTTKLRDSIHAIHNNSDEFEAMEGDCMSCHYLSDDGDYLRWDYVKYDVLRGIAGIDADTASQMASFSWNQTEITDHEQMFFKSIKSAPEEWWTVDSQIPDDIWDTWTVNVTGDMDNPFSMTIQELVDTFGTVTQTLKAHCVVNGPGEAMIYQAEVTGIPVSRILEYAQLHDDANMFYPIGEDGYCYNIYTSVALEEECLLVVEMNGEKLYADQGAPISFWGYELSSGNFTKRLTDIQVLHSDGGSWDFYGDFFDPTYGDDFNKPNSGVLTATSGQIFEAGETIHLEGYIDAWNEPITKLEMSFDKGNTWVVYPIENATTKQWVYWNLDLDGFEEGSYLIRLRATSLREDGTEHVQNYLTNFMFNVQ